MVASARQCAALRLVRRLSPALESLSTAALPPAAALFPFDSFSLFCFPFRLLLSRPAQPNKRSRTHWLTGHSPAAALFARHSQTVERRESRSNRSKIEWTIQSVRVTIQQADSQRPAAGQLSQLLVRQRASLWCGNWLALAWLRFAWPFVRRRRIASAIAHSVQTSGAQSKTACGRASPCPPFASHRPSTSNRNRRPRRASERCPLARPFVRASAADHRSERRVASRCNHLPLVDRWSP